jgi:NADH:ubiquinone oxidoreductase subunit 2 (subunit N)
MYWCCISELDLSLSLLAIIVYGLTSLRYYLSSVGFESAVFMIVSLTSNNGGVKRIPQPTINTELLVGLLSSESILLSILFKLGSAPLHLWVIQIYQSISKPLLMYVSTAPKFSLFCFWVSAWHQVWTSYSISVLIGFSVILGSFGALGQPALRTLFAYSTINEIGLMLLAMEIAGFHSMFQHLGIYVLTQLLLWNLCVVDFCVYIDEFCVSG